MEGEAQESTEGGGGRGQSRGIIYQDRFRLEAYHLDAPWPLNRGGIERRATRHLLSGDFTLSGEADADCS
jgi:hypothetical protein